MNPSNPSPTIVNKPAFSVVGLLIHTVPMSPDIPPLWDQLVPRMDELPPSAEPHVSYGLMRYDPAMNALDYMAGNPAGPGAVPVGMDRWDVPENTYAVFETTLATIGDTFGSIYNTWLPTSGYRHAAAPYFERYGENFSPENPALTIYIPIEPAS
jgi:AraC family transcriptional regulator